MLIIQSEKINKDEVFNYNAETRKVMANYWAKVKIAASNANRNKRFYEDIS